MEHKPRQEQDFKLKEVCGTCHMPVAQCACTGSTSRSTSRSPVSPTLIEDEAFTGAFAGAGGNKSASPILPAGTYIQGKYIVDGIIGEGGMGQVFKGTHEALNKSFAIKILRSEVVANNKAIRRFDQEAKATSQLSHPNLCQIFDYGLTDGGMPFLVMDLLEGKDLRDVIEEEGPLKPERVVDIFLAVTDGVDHAHGKGVIHRDLKPSNIILTRTGDVEGVKVVDFGIAKVMPEPGTETNQLTQTGEIFGSPLYMSPEQCQGFKVDGRSDIYSLGCVLYECLTGRPPFEGDNPVQTILKHVSHEPRPFDAAQNVPAGLQTIVMRALAKNPDDRYQSMKELHDDLQRLHDGQAPAKREQKPGTPMQYIKSRKKLIAFGASLFLLSTLAIVGWAFFQYWQAVSPLPPFLAGEQWHRTMEDALSDQSHRNSDYAEEKFRRALDETSASAKPNNARLDVLQRLGDLYIECAEKGENTYSQAKKCFEEASALALKVGTDFDKAHTLERLAEIEHKLKLYLESDKHYQQALQFREKDPNPVFLSSTLMKQANNFKSLKKWNEAQFAYARAAEILSKVPGQELFIGSAYRGIAQCYNMMGKYPEAEGAFKKSEEYLSKAKGMSARGDLLRSVNEHVEMLVRIGKPDDAAALKKQYQ